MTRGGPVAIVVAALLVLGVLIFLFIRIFGEDEPGRPEARGARRRLP